MTQPLYVAFVWHHHQPYYRQPGQDMYVLPWARMHGVKDYLPMAELLGEYPQVRATFNLVPALVEQLEAYASGNAEDPMTLLGRQQKWSEEEKRLLLNLGFSINWQRLAFQYPRYRELIERRDTALRDPDTFSRQDYTDLIALFNLAWTHQRYVKQDRRLAALAAKGRDFTPEDIETIVSVHRELCGRVVSAYQSLAERGQIEITTSPYHHPILPLLVNTDHALRTTPNIEVPRPTFKAPEDAQAQVARGVAFYEERFGVPPRGMWPSEQAVSPEVAAILKSQGVEWFISDEAVLGRSLGVFFHRDHQEQVQEADVLYRPYRVSTEYGDLYAVFRDHTLSDKIGFVYMHYPPHQAAEDLVVRLQTIYYRLKDRGQPFLVVIALDGENAWEHYQANGEPFLRDLYRRLSDHPLLKTTTVSEFLDLFPPKDGIGSLATGSWINGDLTTWIGDPEHTRAWTLLRNAYTTIQERADAWAHNHERQEAIQRARHHLHVAEASDWFWWYSRRSTSDQDALFDALFRANVAEVYRTLGLPVPREVETPIIGVPVPASRPLRAPVFTPHLTADPDPSREWAAAVVLRPRTSVGTMQMAQFPLRALRIGYDEKHIYVRVELGTAITDDLVISFTGPNGAAGDVLIHPLTHKPELWRYSHRVADELPHAARGDVVEVAVPLRLLELYPGDTVGVRAGVFLKGRLQYAIPPDTPYLLPLDDLIRPRSFPG